MIGILLVDGYIAESFGTRHPMIHANTRRKGRFGLSTWSGE